MFFTSCEHFNKIMAHKKNTLLFFSKVNMSIKMPKKYYLKIYFSNSCISTRSISLIGKEQDAEQEEQALSFLTKNKYKEYIVFNKAIRIIIYVNSSCILK